METGQLRFSNTSKITGYIVDIHSKEGVCVYKTNVNAYNPV